MKRAILTFMLFAFSLTDAQEMEISETDLYEKAEASVTEYYNRYSEADSAIIRTKTYQYYSSLVKNFPKSENYIYYLYTKGCFAHDRAEQKQCFKEVSESGSWAYYRRKALIYLCSYAIDEKEFISAKQYLDAIGKMKKPTFTCGNERETDNSQLEAIRKRLYVAMKD